MGEESPSHGLAVSAPFRQGGQGDGVRIATASVRTGFAMTGFCKECGTRPAGGQRRPPLRTDTRGAVQGGRVVREADPYGCVARNAVGRDDVGSELSAASDRGSEVSEWPRSKFPASAVRQRRNFGHRNRVIVPYGAQRAYYFDF